jgi:hypothetical protein
MITDQHQEAEMKQLLFHNRYYNRRVVMIVLFSEHYQPQAFIYSVVFYTCLDRHARRIHRIDCLRCLGHLLLLHIPRPVSSSRTQAFSMMLTFLFGHIQ